MVDLGGNNEYVMLIASLPRPGPLFVLKQTPMSRFKLEQRLRVLTPEHAQSLKLVEQVLDWGRLRMHTRDEEVIARTRQALNELESETLCNIVKSRLELRTLIAALRMRAAGRAVPPTSRVWGYGGELARITHNWSAPDFGLSRRYPWLAEADRLIRQGDALALERIILEEAYRDLERRGGLHLFDFEAVVIYVLKWNIVDRWARQNADGASRRFDELTETGLGAFSSLSFET
ncbi:MAG: hypothetical protein AAF446_00515 [Pseudomonadota bacterium]